MATGYVYIMINPSFKENIIKVGQTTNIEKRIKDLSHSSGIPTPFQVYALMKTTNYVDVERALHNILEKVVHKRVNAKREFFEIKPDEAYFLMQQLAQFIEDAEITLANEQIDLTFTPDKDAQHKYVKAENLTLEAYKYYEFNKELYSKLKEELLKLHEGVQIVYKQKYVAFKYKTNFVDVVFQKQGLRLTINLKYSEINDPKHLTEDVSHKGRWGNGEVSMHVINEDNITDAITFAKQALSKQI